MQLKEKRELYKELNKELCDLCKEGEDINRISYLIDAGADMLCNGCRPMFLAAKKHNFKLINLLIQKGALEDIRNREHISRICDYMGFTDRVEELFFELIDRMFSLYGLDIRLLTPYINSMLIHGRVKKIFMLIRKYDLSPKIVAENVYPGAIFEIINNEHYNSMDFINENCNWMTQKVFDMAVDSDEIMVVEYILENSKIFQPSEASLSKAVFEGNYDMLDLLLEYGCKFLDSPLIIAKAAQSFYRNGEEILDYLLRNGYDLKARYGGMSFYDIAVREGGKEVADYLNSIDISKMII